MKIFLICLFSIFLIFTCSSLKKEQLIIFNAGSLALPLSVIVKEYKKLNPNLDIRLETKGSRLAARQVSELGMRADICALSDFTVIQELLYPDNADWILKYLGNEITIAYSEMSRMADSINEDNWSKILLIDSISYGVGDADFDPCGYRTIMLWKLHSETRENSNRIFKELKRNCPKNLVRKTAEELVPILENGDLDYAFVYKSVASQHNLKYLNLPSEINMGDKAYELNYNNAKAKVSGRRPGKKLIKTGTTICYGFTIPSTAINKKEALKFLEFLVSELGQKIFKSFDFKITEGFKVLNKQDVEIGLSSLRDN